MEHKSFRVSMITVRHSDAIQSGSLTCQFTNSIEEQRPDISAFLNSSGSKALHIRFMDGQTGGEWENGIKIMAVII